jgi:hypothetical protein
VSVGDVVWQTRAETRLAIFAAQLVVGDSFDQQRNEVPDRAALEIYMRMMGLPRPPALVGHRGRRGSCFQVGEPVSPIRCAWLGGPQLRAAACAHGHSARRRKLHIPASWPWANDIVAVFTRIAAIPLPA